MKKIRTALILVIMGLMLSGCLTVEKKEYLFELNDNGSGKLTIRYLNILSVMDDTVIVTGKDYAELIESYLNGTRIEDDFGGVKIIEKTLFEENEQLCGRVVMEFTDMKMVGLYRYDGRGPDMLNLSFLSNFETFMSSNGDFGGEVMPVIFWDENLRKLQLTTSVTPPNATSVSLLDNYRSNN